MPTQEETRLESEKAYHAHLKRVLPLAKARLLAAIESEIKGIAADPDLNLWIERVEGTIALDGYRLVPSEENPEIPTGPESSTYKARLRVVPFARDNS